MKPECSGEEIILRSLGCQKTDPSYDEFQRAYREVEGNAVKAADVRAAARIGRIPDDFPKSMRFYGRDLIFFCISLGEDITKLSEKYISEGEFIKGMIVDAIADNCLFSCEKIILHEIEKYARNKQFGIEGIFDAPDSIEGKMQMLIAAMLDAENNLSVSVTGNYMMSPVKSYACVMPMVSDASVMNIYHDCSKCTMKECSYRKG